MMPSFWAHILVWGLVVFAPGAAGGRSPETRWMKAIVGQAQLLLEIADTPFQRYQGLSDRDSLAPDRGMAFIYPQPGNRVMVMRRMRFGLDFLWVRNRCIIGVTPGVPPPRPGQDPRLAASPGPVDMVIEVPAGWTQKHGVTAGEKVAFRVFAE